jgi:hypothetical protein
MKLVRGLARHLTFANVLACVALFAALSGGAYAATKINGNSIKKESIGAGKLKKGTITSTQVKPGSLNSTVIDMSTLTTVPSANTATSSQTAQTANTAQTADSAKTAETAKSAETAKTADHATSASSATNADHATSAQTATTADHADTADDAATVEGESASDLISDLTVRCKAGTEQFGGMCWDETTRSVKTWFGAVSECGDAEGRLPSLGELVAFVTRPGVQVTGQTWTDDVEEFEGGAPKILTNNETFASSSQAGNTLGFRCVFYLTN